MKMLRKVDTKKSKIIKILNIVIVILLIFSSVMTYKYFILARDYEDTVNGWTELVIDGWFPNIYYATIKEIDDLDIYTTEVKITIEGLEEYNDAIYRGEFYFQFSVSDIGDYIKVIDSNGKEVDFVQLREGQDVAVYQYGYLDDDDLSRLTNVRRIQILGDGTYEFEDDEEDSEVF